MANNNFYVDISPEMQLYKILQRQSYGIDTALAEFVDNSVQSFVDKERAIKSIDGPDASLQILITISSKNNQLLSRITLVVLIEKISKERYAWGMRKVSNMYREACRSTVLE